MDCGKVRADALAYQSGNLTEEESIAVGKHMAECPDCLNDGRDSQSTLALLKSLDEVTPSEHVWQTIKSQINRSVPGRNVRPGSLRALVRFAAAASLLVAALSFVFVAGITRPSHAATVSLVAPDAADLRPGKRVVTGEPFHAPTYVVLTLPDIGLLKLNRDTDIRFETPTRVHLTRGEMFAEVTSGFVVQCRDAVVTVQGTRFGVRADQSPSTIYVVEGKVEVSSTSGRMHIEGGRMASVGGAPAELSDEELVWMAQFEPVMISLELPRTTALKLGDSPTWRISMRTSSPAPLSLEPLKDLPNQLFLKIVDADRKAYSAPLGSAVSPESVRQSRNGSVRLDVMTPCVLSYRVEPALFPGAGRYTVTLVYQGRHGVLQSDPVQVEVR